MNNQTLASVKRIGTGLSFILYPIFAGIAFFAHPNLLSLEVGGPVTDKIAEFHGNPFMHFGHFMMLLGVPLLIVITIKFMRMLEGRSDWLGFIGGALAVFGAVVLAVDKTALCLVMSAFETVPEAQYAGLIPGIEALFGFKGYLAILYFLPLLPIGALVQAVGLYRTKLVPRWSSVLIIISMLGMGVSAAVDIDLFGLVATLILAVSYIYLGVQVIRKKLD
jgi:hypothetical protein